ncbi:MAG: hypothetical protein QOH10_2838 [Actinomycetota bacterium]|jgi:hypothetical protein|nr:hypothetical protein [Actinomycetota bacterium]
MARDGGGDETLVEIGQWPRLDAQIMRHRLESADVTVMVWWSGDGLRAVGTLAVPSAQAEFARAVVNELEVDDEVPDTSPVAYIARIEEHLAALAGLLDELRTRLDDGDAEDEDADEDDEDDPFAD